MIKGKAIRRGPKGCETSRLPYFLDNRLTDGGEVASLTRQTATLHPQGDSWYSFLLEADLIGSRTRDLPACSIVPQPSTLPHIHMILKINSSYFPK
jgi:hypothetical protein